MNFALHLPLNGVSFGQCSFAILREIYNMGLEPYLFTIGQPDVSSQKIDPDFGNWINKCINKAIYSYDRNIPILKLWHIDGSLESFAKEQTLMTFYELDQPTEYELNVIKNNKNVIVSNKYTSQIFQDYGVNNVKVVPLGFDKYNFNVKSKKYIDDCITFNILGKYEFRKAHKKTIQAWISKYGNNPSYRLQCAIYNPFYNPQENEEIIRDILENKKIFNVQFLGYMQQNELYNDLLNSANIVLAMSCAEGWGLGEFHSLALGKYCVGLNAHAHKDWMNNSNSVLVNPNGKVPAYDDRFFVKGRHVNQGNIFSWDKDEFLNACDIAIQKATVNPINHEGLKLQEKFTYKNTAEEILKILHGQV